MDYLDLTAVGRLTADATLFKGEGKEPMASFAIAINVPDVRYVECELRGDRAQKMLPMLRKGKEVLVTGMPFVSAYIFEGQARASQKISVQKISLGNIS